MANGVPSSIGIPQPTNFDHHTNGPVVTPWEATIDNGMPISSLIKNGNIPSSLEDPPLKRAEEDVQETIGKTNHVASLCFGTAGLFMILCFYEGYRSISNRTVSLFIRAAFWALAATIIGTVGEILQKTTKVEPAVVPNFGHNPMMFKEGQFPGMPNTGNTCFINAPTQAIMNDPKYPRVFKSICEKAKRRHEIFKKFLGLYPSQNPYLIDWTKIFSRAKKEPPLAVENAQDVLIMLMTRRSSIKYEAPEFQRKYPIIHGLIGEFLKVRRDTDFPPVSDDDPDLRKEFGLMKEDPDIIRFFYREQSNIANELLGFEAYLNLINAYETAVAKKAVVASFGRWLASPFSLPIGNIRNLIKGAEESSQEDVEEFLHCLSKYVLPDDYPEVFFPIAYERTWAECPEAEQDQEELERILERHQTSTDFNDKLTELPLDRKTLEKPSPFCILKIEGFLREGVSGQVLIDETFCVREGGVGSATHIYLDRGQPKKYYMVSERIVLSENKTPERMILELVRYEWKETEEGRRRIKIDCAVNMPDRINIHGHEYHLNSIVMHTGSPENGHYYTLVNKQDKWWYASDSTVDIAEDLHVQQASKDGYLYFYEEIPATALESLE
jgi:hypothetical protein